MNASGDYFLIHINLGLTVVLHFACGGIEQCLEDVDCAFTVLVTHLYWSLGDTVIDFYSFLKAPGLI